MSVYIGESNTARAVRYICVGVNNVARRVKKAYIGVDNTARLVYQMGTPIGSVGVGSTVNIRISGVLTEFIVVSHGLPSNSYDSSCYGAWLLMKNIYERYTFGSNNYYESSDVNTYLNSTFYNLFDSGTKKFIRQAKIPYQDKYGTVISGENGLSTNVFLPSLTELNLTASYSNAIGSALSYFSAGNSRVAYLSGNTAVYWTRTPYRSDGVNQYAVNATGSAALYGCSGNFGVRPMIILSSDALVDENNNLVT